MGISTNNNGVRNLCRISTLITGTIIGGGRKIVSDAFLKIGNGISIGITDIMAVCIVATGGTPIKDASVGHRVVYIPRHGHRR